MRLPYLVLLMIAIFFVITGCDSLGGSPATPPFARYTAQQVVDALRAADLSVENPQPDRTVGRGAPTAFSERVVFEIASIAPVGGQIVVFTAQADMAAWQSWIESMRNDPNTRREVVHVFYKDNVLLQINTSLTGQDANAYRDALLALP